MQRHGFSTCLDPHPGSLRASTNPLTIQYYHSSSSSFPQTTPSIIVNYRCSSCSIFKTIKNTPSSQLFNANSPNNTDSTALFGGGDGEFQVSDDSDLTGGGGGGGNEEDDGIQTEIETTGNNSRRIRSRIAIEAGLQTVWNILTDYERLPDFIPSLSLSQLLEKRPNFARLFQIGQQKLAFGLNFSAKGIVDCFEKDLESLPFGQRRDIEFKMIEGDFKLFEGKWSIEQYNIERRGDGEFLVGQEFHTTLSYAVDVEPKLWLPVHLVEGRLCREIKRNLSCIRLEAQKANYHIPDH